MYGQLIRPLPLLIHRRFFRWQIHSGTNKLQRQRRTTVVVACLTVYELIHAHTRLFLLKYSSSTQPSCFFSIAINTSNTTKTKTNVRATNQPKWRLSMSRPMARKKESLWAYLPVGNGQMNGNKNSYTSYILTRHLFLLFKLRLLATHLSFSSIPFCRSIFVVCV